jgi:polyisoprenoid-binding protein YceI
MTRLFLTVAFLASMGLAACKSGEKAGDKKEPAKDAPAKAESAEATKKPDTTSPTPDTAKPAAATDKSAATTTPAAADPPPEQDYVRVIARHEPSKPTDPVKVYFEKFAVTKASFDPAKIEGGTAEIEIDLGSIKTDAPDRDKHLKSKDFLEVEKYPKATIKISDVKKGSADGEYTAKADIDIHGGKVSWPVKFKVIDKKADSIRVEGTHEFTRAAIKVGAPPSKDLPVSDALKFEVRLTLKKAA